MIGRAKNPTYEWKIPFAWRALAALTYISYGFGLGLLIPFLVWTIFRNRFLRTHAVNAGLLHLFGLGIIAVLYALNFSFVVESEQMIVSLAQMWGQIFSYEWPIWGGMMLLQTLLFLLWVMRSLRVREVQKQRPHFVKPGRIFGLAILGVLLVVILFYNSLFWPAGPAQPFVNSARFRDPFVLFPGHLVLSACLFFAIIALEGRLHRFPLARALYGRFLKDEKAVGPRRQRSALLRSLLLPGWGQFFLGQRASGISTLCVFALVSFFLTISFWMNYAGWVAEIPGLNANAGWYFLGELGMRSHIPDKAFHAIFGKPLTLAVLGLTLLLVYASAYRFTKRLAQNQSVATYRLVVAHSVLLHLTPIVILLLIPVSFIPLTPQKQAPQEAFRYVPEFFERPQRTMPLDGAVSSGDESKTYGRPGAAGTKERGKSNANAPKFLGPGPRNESGQGRPDHNLLLDERTGKDPKGGRPGKRQDMTYSNYLSAKIRGAEKGFSYWDRLPVPYSAVFEYKISDRGEVYDIKILEASRTPEADKLTVDLIRSMGVVLPPPGGGHAIVRELFWNTNPGDTSLPTPLQRNLSHAFDGRSIQKF